MAKDDQDSERVELDDEQWRQRLDPEQYRVTREGGTERAFTGAYWDTKTPGRYRCVCCGADLFSSEHKYDSGSGWPSFSQPASGDPTGDGEGPVLTRRDRSHGMVRTEVSCARCDAHLGHVFPDGPAPTGLRFCINSAALELEEEGD